VCQLKTYTWKEAFENSLQAAQAGIPRAQNFVGYCYDVGKGVRRDMKMARYWFEKAARNGNTAAFFKTWLYSTTWDNHAS